MADGIQDSPAADIPAIFKAKDLQFTELRMATRCKTRAIENGPDPHSQLHVKIHPWKKWTGNAGTVVVGVALGGPRCGVGAEPTVKLVGGGMEPGEGDPGASGRALVTGETKASGCGEGRMADTRRAVCGSHGGATVVELVPGAHGARDEAIR